MCLMNPRRKHIRVIWEPIPTGDTNFRIRARRGDEVITYL